jgi:hypothetical protein
MLIPLQRRSLRLGDPAALSVRAHSPFCTDIECARCHAVVRFFCGPSFAYVGSLPEAQQPYTGPTMRALPSLLQALLADPRTPARLPGGDGVLGDSDFDLMFSRKVPPVIGSFKPVMGVADDAPWMCSPFTPHTYFA